MVVSEVPGVPDAAVTTITTTSTFAIDAIFVGDTATNGVSSNTAWKNFGYDIDGKITTATSTDVCTRFVCSRRESASRYAGPRSTESPSRSNKPKTSSTTEPTRPVCRAMRSPSGSVSPRSASQTRRRWFPIHRALPIRAPRMLDLIERYFADEAGAHSGVFGVLEKCIPVASEITVETDARKSITPSAPIPHAARRF